VEPACTRRHLLGVAAVLVVGACSGPPAPVAAGSFTVRHRGRSVRCLYHRSAATTVPPLGVVLLHGAGTDATQWVDIGMDRAVDAVAANHPTPVVAVAPDLHAGNVSPLLLDALLPAIEARFGTHGAFAVSGISRGAGQALATAVAAPGRFGSIGLHSPAVAGTPRGPLAPVLIDAGMDDTLQPAARRLAADLARANVAVTAMWGPGGHDRRYWRANLPRYLEFHVTTHETTT